MQWPRSTIEIVTGASFAVLGLTSAWMGVHALLTGRDMAIVYFAVGMAAGWLLCFAAWRITGMSRSGGFRPPDPMGRSASRWMRSIQRTRRFPDVELGTCRLPEGECALLAEASTMIRKRVGQARATGGIRVEIGKQAFHFGRSEPITRQALRTSATGRLILTDQAILFSGETHTYTVALTKVRSIEPYSREAIVVALHQGTKPAIFLVANPILWSLVVRMAVQHPLTGGHIPDLVDFDHGPASAPRAA